MNATHKKAPRHNWRPFQEAHVFVHSLGLKNKTEWATWAKTTGKPDDIPANPLSVYRKKGWVSWGDWLGTDTIANFNRRFRPFKEARDFAHNLGLKNFAEWVTWAKNKARPIDIPANPYTVYKDSGWISWGDWLGTGRIASQNMVYRSIEDARAFVHKLDLKNREEWNVWAKSATRPDDIPVNPSGVYKDKGWVSMGDWLGTRNRKGGYHPFPDARAFVRSLELKNKDDWTKWAKSDARPDDIPASPSGVYKNNGWVSMGDWVGTGRIANQNMVYCSIEDARAFVHKLGLKNREEWNVWAKSDARPDDIPAYPERVYKDNGWVSMGDWLGTGRIASGNMVYRPFQEARIFVRNLKLNGKDEWAEWAKSDARPNDIPAGPSSIYKGKGWIGWRDWLGTGTVATFNKAYRSFEEARKLAHELGFRNQAEWQIWAKSGKRPVDIPATPQHVYKNKGWIGWGDWLGTGRIANKNMVYHSFEEAHAFVRSLGLQNRSDWQVWAESDSRPVDIPRVPDHIYRSEGWVSWGDWLGTGRIANQNIAYRPFGEARAFVRSLDLQNQSKWRAWIKSRTRPDDIPSAPDRVYQGKGWKSWGDWLGTRNRKGGYRSFNEARTFAHNLGLASGTVWESWAKTSARPDDIPANPAEVYKNKGWTTWGDWLGTNRIATFNMVHRSFEEARDFVRGLALKNQAEWIAWARSEERPEDIPIAPNSAYRNKGWTNWGEWLGTRNRKGGHRPFIEACEFVRNLKLQNQSDWRAWAKSVERPDDIPADPQGTYQGKGWAGWGDWLGVFNLWK